MLLIGCLLPACTIARPAGVLPTLKIGLVAPFEGLHRPLGYEALFGVKLALQERNAGAGVQGYRVELVALNDFDDPAEAAVQARTLVADPDVAGVVGHLSAETTRAAMPVYRRAGLAVSVPWSIGPADAGWPGAVSIAANEAETSARLVEVGRAMGWSQMMDLSEIDPIPAQIEALQVSGEAVAAAERILDLRRAGVTLPLLGQVNVGSPQLPQVAGPAADGLVFVSPGPDPADVPGSENFIGAYQELAGFRPGPRAVLAYDATQVLLNAIGQAIAATGGLPRRAQISAVLAQVQRQGLSGSLAFDEQGRRLDAPVWVYEIMKEEYPGVLVTPVKRLK